MSGSPALDHLPHVGPQGPNSSCKPAVFLIKSGLRVVHSSQPAAKGPGELDPKPPRTFLLCLYLMWDEAKVAVTAGLWNSARSGLLAGLNRSNHGGEAMDSKEKLRWGSREKEHSIPLERGLHMMGMPQPNPLASLAHLLHLVACELPVLLGGSTDLTLGFLMVRCTRGLGLKAWEKH